MKVCIIFKMCGKKEKENEKQTIRVETKMTALRCFQKKEKTLSFEGLFFYCCPLRDRLSGLLHKASPLQAERHWLSCHFILTSWWRTAAPEGRTCHERNGRETHTHAHPPTDTHTHTWTKSKEKRRCWAKWEHTIEPRSGFQIVRTIILTLFQLSPITHTPTHAHT